MKISVLVAAAALATSAHATTLDQESLKAAIGKSRQVANALGQKKTTLICLEVGRLDAAISKLVEQVSIPHESFEDQRKDPARDPLFSAHERVTALTGYCGELSGEKVAGYRYMPKLKTSPKDLKAGVALSKGIASDLESLLSR